MCTLEGIDKLALKIENYFGRLNVKLVLGENIYFSNLEKIDKTINEGKHFEENLEFLDFVRKKKKIVNVGKTRLYPSPERRGKETKRENVSMKDGRIKSEQKEKGYRSRSRSKTASDRSKVRSRLLSKSRDKSRDKKVVKIKRSKSRSNSRSKSRGKSLKKRKRSKSRSRSKRKRREQRSRSRSKEYNFNRDNVKSEKEGKVSKMSNVKSDKKKQRERSKSISGNEKELKIPTESTQDKTKGKRVLSFLEGEVEMLKMMEGEKSLYYDTPSKHDLYESEWGKFWIKKYKECQAKGVNINDKNLTREWTVEWRNFFDNQHEKKKSEERMKLLDKWNLTNEDIEWFNSNKQTVKETKAPEVISLIDSDDDSDQDVKVVRSNSPWESNSPPPPVHSKPSTSKISEGDAKGRRGKMQTSPKNKISADDVSILCTLRFLKKIDTENLLGRLGPKVDKMLDTALGLEGDEYGSSQLLVDENECHALLDQARELIQHNLAGNLVPDKSKHVCKLTVDNIAILLKQSTCQENEILEIDNSTLSKSGSLKPPISNSSADHDSRLIKKKIAETIEKVLVDSGTQPLSQEDFNSLVEAEFVRIKHQLPSWSNDQNAVVNAIQSTLVLPPTAAPIPSGSSTHQLFSAYTAQDLPQSQVPYPPPTVQYSQFPGQHHQEATSTFPRPSPNFHPYPPNLTVPPPNMIERNETPNIDWGSLINILSTVKKKEEEKSRPIMEEVPAVKTEPEVYDMLTEEEVVHLIKNFKELDEEERKNFLSYMKRLENENPEKVKRLKAKMHSK